MVYGGKQMKTRGEQTRMMRTKCLKGVSEQGYRIWGISIAETAEGSFVETADARRAGYLSKGVIKRVHHDLGWRKNIPCEP